MVNIIDRIRNIIRRPRPTEQYSQPIGPQQPTQTQQTEKVDLYAPIDDAGKSSGTIISAPSGTPAKDVAETYQRSNKGGGSSGGGTNNIQPSTPTQQQDVTGQIVVNKSEEVLGQPETLNPQPKPITPNKQEIATIGGKGPDYSKLTAPQYPKGESLIDKGNKWGKEFLMSPTPKNIWRNFILIGAGGFMSTGAQTGRALGSSGVTIKGTSTFISPIESFGIESSIGSVSAQKGIINPYTSFEKTIYNQEYGGLTKGYKLNIEKSFGDVKQFTTLDLKAIPTGEASIGYGLSSGKQVTVIPDLTGARIIIKEFNIIGGSEQIYKGGAIVNGIVKPQVSGGFSKGFVIGDNTQAPFSSIGATTRNKEFIDIVGGNTKTKFRLDVIQLEKIRNYQGNLIGIEAEIGGSYKSKVGNFGRLPSYNEPEVTTSFKFNKGDIKLLTNKEEDFSYLSRGTTQRQVPKQSSIVRSDIATSGAGGITKSVSEITTIAPTYRTGLFTGTGLYERTTEVSYGLRPRLSNDFFKGSANIGRSTGIFQQPTITDNTKIIPKLDIGNPLGFRQSTTTRQPTTFKTPTGTTPGIVPIVTPPNVPFKFNINIPNLKPNFDFSGGSKNIYGKTKYKYTPSFSALVFDIRGKAPKRITGAEIRPITKGFSFAYSGGKLL